MTDDLACKEFVEQVTDYLEGALPPAERARFEAHLEECEFCTEYLEQTKTVSASLRHAQLDALPDDRRAALLDAFRARERD